jgi:L-alanine-DL-glutamate epimerase-like enolase superfamily enzyme
MEFPWRGPHRAESWYTPQFVIRNGMVKVPSGPGLGVEYDPQFLRRAQKVEV